MLSKAIDCFSLILLFCYSPNMVNRILKGVIEGKITLEELITWLEHKVQKTWTVNKVEEQYEGSQCAFVEYVTKFVYEEIAWLLENNDAQVIPAKSIVINSKRASFTKQDSQNDTSLSVDDLYPFNDNQLPIFGITTSRLNEFGRVSLNTASTSQSALSSPATQAKEWPAVGERRSQNTTDNSEADCSVLNTSENKAWLSTGLDFDASYKMIAHKAGPKTNTSDTSYQAISNIASSTTPTHNKAWPSAGRWETDASDVSWHVSSDTGSPGSPAFTGRKSGTGNKTRNSTPKSTKINPNISLADFIIDAKPKKKGKQKMNFSNERLPSKDDSMNEEWSNIRTPSPVNSRAVPEPAWVAKKDPKPSTGTIKRIKPTKMTAQGVSIYGRVTPQDTNNVFSFEKKPEVEFPAENSQQQRENLLVERLKLSTRVELSDARLSNTKTNTPRSVRNTKLSVQINIDLVTYKEQLKILSQIFSLFMDTNLIRNISSALYYIISIVVTRLDKLETNTTSRDATDDGWQLCFKSAHNCVFFAVNVLRLQSELLSILDRVTIKLLLENTRIQHFAPDLISKLNDILAKKIERKLEYPRDTVTNAGFVLDTDARGNFMSASSFHTFRKQRDVFCSCFDIWKNDHTEPDFRFEKVLGDKIRRLHYLHADPNNSLHLARLFKNKLMQDCLDDPMPTNQKQLPNVDAEKLTRLENRLTSKRNTSAFLSEPFPGNEEFYKEFIATTNSNTFHTHLKDCLVVEILQLDDSEFWPSEIEDTETAVDLETRKKFITCLKSLRLLSKFLAFLESLPYRTQSAVAPPKLIMITQLELRQHFVPAINVEERIKMALKFGKLSVTIPWVTEYIAMFDYVTLRVPYFSQLVEMLYKIQLRDNKSLGFMRRIEGPFMVKFCLGWLFELRHFPIETYYKWLPCQYHFTSQQEDVDDPPTFQCFVDQLDLVDENVLYSVCPYLYEIRSLLTSSTENNTDRPGPAKYIRPITTSINDPDTEEKRRKKIENDMEQLFFQNHPSSLRRVVDFVIERVTSASVKHVWPTMVPKHRADAMECLENHLKHLNEYNFIQKQSGLSCCKAFSKCLAFRKVDEMRLEFNEEMTRQVYNRCTESIGALLTDELFKTVGSVAIDIAKKHAHQKISEWFTTHITPDIVFQPEFDAVIARIECDMKPSSLKNTRPNHQGKKSIVNLCRETVGKNTIKASYNIPSLGRANINHNPDVKSPTMFMIDTHKLLVKVADESHLVTYEELSANIKEARLVFSSRCDYSAKVQYETCECYKRLVYLIVVHVPGLLKTQILKDIMLFWKDFLLKKNYQNFFARFFSPLNVSLFITAPNPAATWDAAADLILALMQEKFVTDDQVEEQAIAMFRFDWPAGTIKHFSRCLRKIVDERIRKRGRIDEYSCTLAWLASFTEDDEYF
ncbi:discs lost [Carabus blaptoides fortunei]